MNDQTDPLARRSVPCPECGGEGRIEIHNPEGDYGENCPVCHGSKTVPEPAEEWAERCAAIAQYLARHSICGGCIRFDADNDCDPCGYTEKYQARRTKEVLHDAARAVSGKE